MGRTTRSVALGIAGALLLAGVAGRASAAVIPTVFGTGVDSSGNSLSRGSSDSHYTMSGAATGAAFVTTSQVDSWPLLGNDESVSQDVAGTAVQNLVTYFTTFSLTGFTPSTAKLTGSFYGDDNVEIFLNGVDTGIGATPAYNTATPFTVSSGFQAGTNTLAFQVTNLGGATANNTGVEVAVTGTASAVPEPASLSLMGFAALGLLGRRRNR